MNTYLFTNPRMRAFDLIGQPMPGALLQFYLTGTTTPTDVFSDAELTTPLTNPVEADSDGVFTAIYMSPTVTYRVQLYSAEDELQWDVDPYTPPRDYGPGTIMMHVGTEEQRDAAFPSALWQLCDGTNGSVDLRDRFPVGASSTKEPGDTGGADIVNSSEAGGIAEGEVEETILDATNLPKHGHRLLVSTDPDANRGVGWDAPRTDVVIQGRNISSKAYIDVFGINTDPLVEESGEDTPAGHTHVTPEVPDHVHQVEITPPWGCVWFLMRRYPEP